jgi:hypothetical protein
LAWGRFEIFPFNDKLLPVLGCRFNFTETAHHPAPDCNSSFAIAAAGENALNGFVAKKSPTSLRPGSETVMVKPLYPRQKRGFNEGRYV